MRWALSLLGALADSAPSTRRTAPPALTIESIGTLALRDVTLVAGSRTLLVDLDSSFTGGDRFVVRRIHGRSEGSDLVVSGELSSVARRTGTFTIDAQTLDLDGLMAFLAAATPAGARGQRVGGGGQRAAGADGPAAARDHGPRAARPGARHRVHQPRDDRAG